MPTPSRARAVAFVVANDGVEQVELTDPWQAVEAAGLRPVLLAPELGHVQAYHHLDRADRFDVDATTDRARAEDYAAVVLPGGVANPGLLRRDTATHRILRDSDLRGAVIAAICHGPWTLIDAGLVTGRTLAAYPSLATDLTNAGATWTAKRTHVEANRVTAQSDHDVHAFTDLLLRALTTT